MPNANSAANRTKTSRPTSNCTAMPGQSGKPQAIHHSGARAATPKFSRLEMMRARRSVIAAAISRMPSAAISASLKYSPNMRVRH